MGHQETVRRGPIRGQEELEASAMETQSDPRPTPKGKSQETVACSSRGVSMSQREGVPSIAVLKQAESRAKDETEQRLRVLAAWGSLVIWQKQSH